MVMYNTWSKDVVTPEDVENSEIIQAAILKIHTKTLSKMIRTVDNAIENLVTVISAQNKFVWTKTGALVGYSSNESTEVINHLWNKSSETFSDKYLLIFVGMLVRWRISLRDETWLLYIQELDEIDPDTNRKKTVSYYWIDENYPYKLPTVNDLIPALICWSYPLANQLKPKTKPIHSNKYLSFSQKFRQVY